MCVHVCVHFAKTNLVFLNVGQCTGSCAWVFARHARHTRDTHGTSLEMVFGDGAKRANETVSKDTIPQVKPPTDKGGSNAIYIGDIDLSLITFGSLIKGDRDSYYPILYAGKDFFPLIKLSKNPGDPVRAPFGAGPYTGGGKTQMSEEDRKKAEAGPWNMRLEAAEGGDIYKFIDGVEQLARAHILKNKGTDEFMAVGSKYYAQGPKGKKQPLDDNVVQALYNSAIKYSSDSEKREKYPPVFGLGVNRTPNSKGGGVPVVQLTHVKEETKSLSKLEMGTIDDLVGESIEQMATMRIARGVYVGGFGTGIKYNLHSTLKFTNKSGRQQTVIDVGDWKVEDTTAAEQGLDNGVPFSGKEELDAPEVPGMEAFDPDARS